jgi:uncharacterized UPF0146 family protein
LRKTANPNYDVDKVESLEGLIEYLSCNYEKVVEVGIGRYPKVALALQTRGLQVAATDIQPDSVGLPVRFDDIRSPRLDLYEGAQVIYAVRPPLELLPSLKGLAKKLAVDLVVKPLAGEPVDGILINHGGSFFYLFPAHS